jgi:hypothetical protein
MAALEVLANKDLVSHIYEAWVCRKATLAQTAPDASSNEHAWRCMRELITGTKVSRVFRQACLAFLETIWAGYEQQMRGFDERAGELLSKGGVDPVRDADFLSKARELALMHGEWAELLFGFDKRWVLDSAGTRSRDTAWQVMNQIEIVARSVRPTTYEEMLYMMEKRCACCGDRCRYHVGAATTAAGMHPYTGSVDISHYSEECGCPVYTQARQHIPHTWQGHTAPVAFIRDEDGGYLMQLRIGCSQMCLGEREVLGFMVGARNEPWYQPRIKRLFDLRPASILNNPRCCSKAHRCRKWTEFTSTIFLLAPRIPHNADWSMQQIFGLGRKETLAYARRGRLILRERRTLCTHY